MSRAATLRQGAEALARGLPALMADAEHLASTIQLGAHGRRRAGMGDEFWQYRPAAAGDSARQIDWRRSARSDAQFVQEKEWQAAQSVMFWVDPGRSMDFGSEPQLPSKAERAQRLALALAVLLVRGGERVGLADGHGRPGLGELQLQRMAREMSLPGDGTGDSTADRAGGSPDYGVVDISNIPAHARAVFVSDFLGSFEALQAAVLRAAERDIKGALLQVLDPQEEVFPFAGRTIFESIARSVRHETLKASDLQGRYLERLAARKEALRDLAHRTGWQYACHHSSESAQSALLWLFGAIGRPG